MRESYYQTRWRDDEREWRARARRELTVNLARKSGTLTSARADILDVGCGTGLLMRDLTTHGRAAGLDVDETPVALCRERGLARTLVASAESLPFPTASFDLVTMIEVLEHVVDDARALRDTARVLRPGGTLVLTVPAFAFLWSARDESLHHQRRYRLPDLTDRITAAGLETVFSTYIDAWLLPPLAALLALDRLRPGRVDLMKETVVVPGPINGALLALCRLERAFLQWTRLPFGVSIACVARKRQN